MMKMKKLEERLNVIVRELRSFYASRNIDTIFACVDKLERLINEMFKR